MDNSKHKSGFINIIGLPNVGKSTLLNAFMGEKMAIVSPKPQTTRQRLFGILNAEDFQMIFSDSPGFVLNPSYKLHEDMNMIVQTAFKDADIIILVNDGYNTLSEHEDLIKALEKLPVPKVVVINKIDQLKAERIESVKEEFTKAMPESKIFEVSALNKKGITPLIEHLIEHLPLHPAYYPKDEISDRPIRYFVSEMVREKIFLNYKKEIPYSTEVVTEDYKDEENIARITVMIYVERNSQKAIILGKHGAAIKNVGIQARKDIEEFIGKQVYLELTVKVRNNWRNDINFLKKSGYR
ncbi:MAG: GTPase Era [Chitinophagales bacterium]|nr:GTPase Era [Chitinophagales bacterium]